jgi:predicted ATPase
MIDSCIYVLLLRFPDHNLPRFFVQSGRRGNVQEGYRYCHVGLLIMERQNAREWQARVALAVVGGVYFMKHPLKDLTKYLRDSHCAGLVSGDVHVSESTPRQQPSLHRLNELHSGR